MVHWHWSTGKSTSFKIQQKIFKNNNNSNKIIKENLQNRKTS